MQMRAFEAAAGTGLAKMSAAILEPGAVDLLQQSASRLRGESGEA